MPSRSQSSAAPILRHHVDNPRYADQAAVDAHLASDAVQELIKLFTTDASLFAAPTNVYTTETAFSFSRPESNKATSPYIVFATLDYQPGTRKGAFNGWQRVTAESQSNEPGTLAYAILKDKDQENTIRTVEVYESDKYLWDVHAKSAAVTDNKAKYGDIRTNLKFAFLKMAAGYLHKEKSSSNL
jgi:quinol monooxygenase YgiN